MEEKKKTRRMSRGKCSFCGGPFSKGAMTRHLKSCKQRKGDLETLSAQPNPHKTKIFHLVVEGRWQPDYWIHLEVGADVSLISLDSFLRDIWLECCGHMSAFVIEGQQYVSTGPFGYALEWQQDMEEVELGKTLFPGMKFYHDYDFGTTTQLKLRVLSEREGVMGDDRVRLLARNDPPPIPCGVCGKLATQVCLECAWSGEGWLCDDCADDHECDEDMFLPVVNSPRVGMCGYTGSTATHQ